MFSSDMTNIYVQTLREIILQVTMRKGLFAKVGFSPLPMSVNDFARDFVTSCPAGTQFLNISPEGHLKLCPCKGSQFTVISAKDSRWRDKILQANLCNPFGIQRVCLSSWNMLDLIGIRQNKVY